MSEATQACKSCGRDFDRFDGLQYGPNRYGWSTAYGDCFLCFCYASFGGLLEPWGELQDRKNQRYQITPPGVPSRCHCDADFDAMCKRIENEMGEEDAYWHHQREIDSRGEPDVNIPF